MRALKVVLAVLVAIIGTLASIATCLMWLDIKPKDLRMTGPHWLWLVAAVAFFVAGVSPSVYLLHLASKQKSAAGQGAMLSHFATQAKDLIRLLEGLWHRWNAAGEVLTHPAGGKSKMENWSADLAYERRDFIVLYSNHLMWLRTEVPAFSSAAVQRGCPSDGEYSDVLADLREHAQLLERAAGIVWKSGRKL